MVDVFLWDVVLTLGPGTGSCVVNLVMLWFPVPWFFYRFERRFPIVFIVDVVIPWED